MIDSLITVLNQEIEMSAEEIADTLWLALQIKESPSGLKGDGSPLINEDSQKRDNEKEGLDGEISQKPSSQTSDQSSEEQKAGIYPRNQQQTSKSVGLSFKTPQASSLGEPLILAGALKPLMRRIPTGINWTLDEAATSQRIADERLWLPVFKPTLEPWLDLELVVDQSLSMQIWRQTITELERLLKNYGIFRDVRVWGLMGDDVEPVQIRRGIGASAKNNPFRSPKELIDRSGRRLILVVSDCVSSFWRNGRVTTTLELWANHVPTAMIQMLPKWLWKRTALARTSEVRLRGLTPGVSNQNLMVQQLSLWEELEEEEGVKLPVFTLEADRVATWAQMVSGRGSIWTSGVVFKLEDNPVHSGNKPLVDYNQLSPEERVQAFRITASPMARKLAGLLAAAPVISLPVVRLIRETLLKQSLQVNVAEVFLGGLLKPLSEINLETNPDDVLYEFIDGVRELLLDSVPSNYVLNVVDEVSKYIAKKVGLSLEEFAAVLRNQKQVDAGIAEDTRYFATVTAQVLRRLGGEYVKLAEELEFNNPPGNLEPTTNPSKNKMFDHGYALLIGVGESADPRLSLPVTVNDTQAIYAALIDPELCAYHQEHIRVLNNADATRSGILEGLNWLKDQAEKEPNATILVYYSGMGWFDTTDNRYYLIQHDVKPTRLAASALSAEVFTHALRQIQSERLLVVLDCCHAAGMVTSKDAEIATKIDAELLEEFDNFERVSPTKEVIDTIKQGENITVFASSRGEQKSWFKQDPFMSIYTHHFLEALQGAANQPGDTEVKVSNLMNYLSKAVPESARQLYGREQIPHFDMSTSDFAIALLRGGKGLPVQVDNDIQPQSKKSNYEELNKMIERIKKAQQEELNEILKIIIQGQYTDNDLEKLRKLLKLMNEIDNNDFTLINDVIGKNIVGKIEGDNIHVGDRVYQQLDEEAIQAIVTEIKKVRWKCVASLTENDYTQVELQSVGIPLIDKLAKNLTDISQQSVMRYGLKLAFSQNPNLGYFISGGNQTIKRWQKRRNNWAIHQEIAVKGNVDLFDLWFTSVAISPDGQYIAACKAYQVIIWRFGEEKALHTLSKTPFSNFFDVSGFDSVSFSPDSKLLAANDNKDVKIWDIETGKEIAKLSEHSDKVTGVVFHPKNERVLASCSYDKTIKLWDLTQQRCLGTLSAHRDAVYTLAFSPDGNILASGSNDNTIKLWNLETGEIPETLCSHSDAVTCLVFTPDGETLISGSNDKTIIEWTISGEKLVTFSERHPRGVTSIAISPDGKTLMSSGRDQTIKVWMK